MLLHTVVRTMLPPRLSLSSSWFLTLWGLLIAFAVRSVADNEPAPIVVPPSQYWEGNDGPWSSYSLSVGTPAITTRVMISTAIPNTWVVLKDACETSSCTASRGGQLFNPNASSTWKQKGFFNLYFEESLNETGGGQYGFETVGLGWSQNSGPTLENQVVAGEFANDFWMGYFGVNPQPTNFSDFDHPIPSYIQTLKDKNMIPSLTYSYTAGAQYRFKKIPGDLILGGYDDSRFETNDVSFNFADDVTRDLVVGLQSIQVSQSNGKNREMLNGGILMYIDSTVPYIILPLSACQEFEDALGLEFDFNTGLYLVSDSLHNSLVSQDANFTFTIGNSVSGGDTVAITLPYAAFDLTAQPPLTNKSSRYFPLKRASNETQYTLGRTFLQEAYLTADYERGNFSVSQCKWDLNAQSHVVTIHSTNWTAPPNSTAGGGGGGASVSGSSSSISVGAIVGIAIAGVVIVLGAVLLFLAKRYNRWPFHRDGYVGGAAPELDSDAIGHEADSKGVFKPGLRPGIAEADSHSDVKSTKTKTPPTELLADQACSELQPSNNKSELPAVNRRGELLGSEAAREIDSADAVPGQAHQTFAVELAGSPVPSVHRMPHGGTTSNGAERSPLPDRSETASPRSTRTGQMSASRAVSSTNATSPSGPGLDPGVMGGHGISSPSTPSSLGGDARNVRFSSQQQQQRHYSTSSNAQTSPPLPPLPPTPSSPSAVRSRDSARRGSRGGGGEVGGGARYDSHYEAASSRSRSRGRPNVNSIVNTDDGRRSGYTGYTGSTLHSSVGDLYSPGGSTSAGTFEPARGMSISSARTGSTSAPQGGGGGGGGSGGPGQNEEGWSNSGSRPSSHGRQTRPMRGEQTFF